MMGDELLGVDAMRLHGVEQHRRSDGVYEDPALSGAIMLAFLDPLS
jgi:hypothetical protein